MEAKGRHHSLADIQETQGAVLIPVFAGALAADHHAERSGGQREPSVHLPKPSRRMFGDLVPVISVGMI